MSNEVCNIDENNKNEKSENSALEVFNIISVEYTHVTERANKLDNKVSIILAFTGVVFITALGLLDIQLQFPINEAEFNNIVIFLLFSILDILLYTAAIFLYLIILLPKNMKRVDSYSLLLKQLQKGRPDVTYNYVSTKYCNSILENNSILNKQYVKLHIGIILEIIAIVLSVALIFTKYIIL